MLRTCALFVGWMFIVTAQPDPTEDDYRRTAQGIIGLCVDLNKIVKQNQSACFFTSEGKLNACVEKAWKELSGSAETDLSVIGNNYINKICNEKDGEVFLIRFLKKEMEICHAYPNYLGRLAVDTMIDCINGFNHE